MTVNGWNLFYFRLFKQILDQLEAEVTVLAQKDPEGFIHHKKAKLLKAVVDNVKIEVPRQPDHPDFWLGGTLGKNYKDWRRVKRRLPPRYRLFFKFASSDKRIIYVWLNDESTLRKEGAKTDVYAVFKKMLHGGKVPNSFADLLKNSKEFS
jgi:toxin YhaV